MKLLPLLLLLALPAVVQAQFAFTTKNGAITITGYTGSGGTVVIPGTTNGYPVVAIGQLSFQFKSAITSVIIPDSVTNIGSSAFYYCTGLTNAVLGTNTITIGDYAFYSCSALPNINLPTTLMSIGSSAFAYSRLTNALIPASVTSIGGGPFSVCTHLAAITVESNSSAYSSLNGVLFNKSQTLLLQCPIAQSGVYTIPNTVGSIGYDAFAYCQFTNFTIPTSVTNISGDAFRGCAGITNISIPASIISIGISPFVVCNNLTAINVDTNNPAYTSADGVLYDKGQTALIEYPAAKAGSYYNISNSVTTIWEQAFFDCYNLAKIVIPSGVTNIGGSAFYSCRSLTSLLLPPNLISMGDYAFEYCTNLTSVTIPNKINSISYGAFQYCSSMATVTIGSGVTNINDDTFYQCTKLKSVYFQGVAPAYGAYAFYQDNSATVYYLSGKSGWTNSFAGRPAVLWNPQAQNDSSLGVQSNQFGFTITGSSNLVIVVEACTNMGNAVWSPVSTNTLNTFVGTNGTSYFSDPTWTSYCGRFYRLRSP